jgi:hypothetical protein
VGIRRECLSHTTGFVPSVWGCIYSNYKLNMTGTPGKNIQ